MKDTDKTLERTMDIIKKYYDHSTKNPVLKYTSPDTFKKKIKLNITKEGIKIAELFSEIEKIVLNSPKTNSK
ncbi:MAG: hypothetical protein WCL18_01680 [bacterium]